MSGSIFPLDPGKVSWNAKVKPEWEVTEYVSASQGRKSLTHQSFPTWQFDVSFPRLTEQEVETLKAFFMTCKGSWNPFYYKDAERYAADVTLKGAGTYYYKANGLPLFIPIEAGDYVFKEPCYMADVVRVYRDGVEDTENFTVIADDSGQLRVYLTDVETTEGVLQDTVITATYEYYYKVKFQNSITLNQKFKNLYSASLSLKTVRQAITNTGDNDKWNGSGVYNVRLIQQGAHQTITVKKYVNGEVKGTYTGSFQVVGKCILEVTVEPESGYLAGDLYINNRKRTSGVRLTPTEDLVIYALPAEMGSTVYINGTVPSWWGYQFYSDEECTQTVYKNDLYGKITIIDKSTDGLPYWGNSIVGNNEPGSYRQYCANATSVDVSDIDVSVKTSLDTCFRGCGYLRKIIGLSAWNPVNVTSCAGMCQSCGSLVDIGDISHWQMPVLRSAAAMFANTSLKSVNLHDWYTPELESTREMFAYNTNLEVVDVSGIDTRNTVDMYNTFATNYYSPSGTVSQFKYLIIDSEELKFEMKQDLSATYTFPRTTKILVPRSKLEDYKAWGYWANRASQFYAVEDFDIVRNGGEITVTPRAS